MCKLVKILEHYIHNKEISSKFQENETKSFSVELLELTEVISMLTISIGWICFVHQGSVDLSAMKQ